MADIFVSYTSSDRDWAFWIGLELEKLGHTAHLHEWEISAGGDIPAWMEDPEQTKTGNLGDIFQMRAPLGGGYARIRIREVEIVNVPSATPDPAFVSELNERVIFTDTTIPLPYGEAF